LRRIIGDRQVQWAAGFWAAGFCINEKVFYSTSKRALYWLAMQAAAWSRTVCSCASRCWSSTHAAAFSHDAFQREDRKDCSVVPSDPPECLHMSDKSRTRATLHQGEEEDLTSHVLTQLLTLVHTAAINKAQMQSMICQPLIRSHGNRFVLVGCAQQLIQCRAADPPMAVRRTIANLFTPFVTKGLNTVVKP
jgi:hypothetical protein